jgi:hypothetical protein
MCDVCRDLVREIVWYQLALDDSHEVRWTQRECQCGAVLVNVAVGLMVDAER